MSHFICILLVISFLDCQNPEKSTEKEKQTILKDSLPIPTKIPKPDTFPKKLSSAVVQKIIQYRNTLLPDDVATAFFLEIYGDTLSQLSSEDCSLVQMQNVDTDADLEIIFGLGDCHAQYYILDTQDKNWVVYQPIIITCGNECKIDKKLIICSQTGTGSNISYKSWSFYRAENQFVNPVFTCIEEDAFFYDIDTSDYESWTRGKYNIVNTNTINVKYIEGITLFFRENETDEGQHFDIPFDYIYITYIWNAKTLDYQPTSLEKTKMLNNLERMYKNITAICKKEKNKAKRKAIQEWLDSQTENQ